MPAHLCAISAPGWGALQLPSGKVFLDLLLCLQVETIGSLPPVPGFRLGTLKTIKKSHQKYCCAKKWQQKGLKKKVGVALEGKKPVELRGVGMKYCFEKVLKRTGGTHWGRKAN